MQKFETCSNYIKVFIMINEKTRWIFQILFMPKSENKTERARCCRSVIFKFRRITTFWRMGDNMKTKGWVHSTNIPWVIMISFFLQMMCRSFKFYNSIHNIPRSFNIRNFSLHRWNNKHLQNLSKQQSNVWKNDKILEKINRTCGSWLSKKQNSLAMQVIHLAPLKCPRRL